MKCFLYALLVVALCALTTSPLSVQAAEPVKLVMWWWGEQEAPGAQKWLDETIQLYQEKHPNVTIEAVLQSTDSLIPSFQSAMAAQEGPDIQYFWQGFSILRVTRPSGGATGLIPDPDMPPAPASHPE